MPNMLHVVLVETKHGVTMQKVSILANDVASLALVSSALLIQTVPQRQRNQGLQIIGW